MRYVDFKVLENTWVSGNACGVLKCWKESGLIDTGEFRICVMSNNYDESACGTGYNSEAKQPEHLFVNLFAEENRKSPNVDVNSQAQSQNQDNEQSQSQSQNNEQTTTIINCPPDSRCVIEQ